jgi:hypothetical protein
MTGTEQWHDNYNKLYCFVIYWSFYLICLRYMFAFDRNRKFQLIYWWIPLIMEQETMSKALVQHRSGSRYLCDNFSDSAFSWAYYVKVAHIITHLRRLRYTLLNKQGTFKGLYKKTYACENAINNYRAYRKSVMFIINARQLDRTKTTGSMFLIK